MQSSSYVPIAVLFCVAFLLFLGGFAVFFPQGLTGSGRIYSALVSSHSDNNAMLQRHVAILQADFDALATQQGYSKTELENLRKVRESKARNTSPKSKDDENIRICNHWATQFQQVKPEVPLHAMRQAMIPKQIKLWDGRNCDEVIKGIGGLLSELLPPKVPAIGAPASSQNSPTSTTKKTSPSPAAGAPKVSDAALNSAEARTKFCKEAFSVHGVVPGKSWGSLPSSQWSQWIDLSCDLIAMNPSPAENKPQKMPTLSEHEKSHLEEDQSHSHGSNDNHDKHKHEHHAKGTTEEESVATKQCIEWRKTFNVQPGIHWGSLPVSLQDKWDQMHCNDRLPEIKLELPSDRELMDYEFKTPIVSPYDPSRNIIGIIICSTTRGLAVSKLTDLVLFTQVLPGIVKNAELGAEFWIFVGYDEGDPFYDRSGREDEIRQWSTSHVETPCSKRGIVCKIVPHRIVGNDKRKPGYAFNNLAQSAYEAGVHWFYRINDDSVPAAPFAKSFIAALKSMTLPMGVVGPKCTSGNTRILTHDFVHRTHMEVFDYYYPVVLNDWWMDDWITRVYGRKRTKKDMSISIEHTLAHGTRYLVDHSHAGMLQNEVNAGRIRIAAWMKQHGLADADIIETVADSTIYDVVNG